jgi:hypothetical protein
MPEELVSSLLALSALDFKISPTGDLASEVRIGRGGTGGGLESLPVDACSTATGLRVSRRPRGARP